MTRVIIRIEEWGDGFIVTSNFDNLQVINPLVFRDLSDALEEAKKQIGRQIIREIGNNPFGH